MQCFAQQGHDDEEQSSHCIDGFGNELGPQEIAFAPIKFGVGWPVHKGGVVVLHGIFVVGQVGIVLKAILSDGKATKKRHEEQNND